MNVFGVTLMRNEVDVVATCIRHHLALGLDRILVVDNGSTDGTADVLAHLAREHHSRVAWTTDAGPYRQSEIMTALAREAVDLGAEWILPFDADEFWWLPRWRLKDVLATSTAGALIASVRNFVQRRSQQHGDDAALLTMTHRVLAPVGPPETCSERVTAGEIAFVEMEYPPKLIVRASPSLLLAEGNHAASGLDAEPSPTQAALCLHAPLRSREHLDRRRETGQRVEEAFPPGLAWHARRWRSILTDETSVDAEWAANSYDRDESIDVYGKRRVLAYDPTLRDLLLPLLRAHWRRRLLVG